MNGWERTTVGKKKKSKRKQPLEKTKHVQQEGNKDLKKRCKNTQKERMK